MKKIIVLFLPLLLFAVLALPYSLFNSAVVVDWLGCECQILYIAPTQAVKNNFTANDFTKCFWLFVALCATVLSGFLAKRLSKDKVWHKVVYGICVIAVLGISLLLANLLTQSMQYC